MSYEIRVESWNELQDALYADSWQSSINRYRSDYIFRGLTDASWDLKTSLIRLGGCYKDLEFHILRNFRKYGQFKTDRVYRSDLFVLTLAQHHGLPTRLLDWTYSPFVAMHFATDKVQHMDRDGIIWCVNLVEAHKLLPKELREILDEEMSNAFTVEMLEKRIPSLRTFEAISPEDYVLFLEPPSLDARITNQFALFSIMPNSTYVLSDWLAQHPHLFRKIIVSKKIKWEVRDKLDQANITERLLFPGLQGLAQWLTRHYSVREV